MTFLGTPAFESFIAPGDTVIWEDDATPSPAANAMGQGGWLNLDSGWAGVTQSNPGGTYGPGLVADASRGRERVVVAGIVQTPLWSVVATVLGPNHLRLAITRTGGFIATPHTIVFRRILSYSNTGGVTCVAAAAVGGLQVITVSGLAPPFSPADIGRAVNLFSGSIPSLNGPFLITNVPAPDQIEIANPGGAAGNVSMTVGVGNGQPIAFTVNGIPVSVPTTLGDSANTMQTAVRNAVTALAIANLTAYSADENNSNPLASSGSGGPRRSRVVLIGPGLVSLSYPTAGGIGFLQFESAASVRFWSVNQLFSVHPYTPPNSWDIAAVPGAASEDVPGGPGRDLVLDASCRVLASDGSTNRRDRVANVVRVATGVYRVDLPSDFRRSLDEYHITIGVAVNALPRIVTLSPESTSAALVFRAFDADGNAADANFWIGVAKL